MKPQARIKRIQRWLTVCGEMAPSCEFVHRGGPGTSNQEINRLIERQSAADGLFAAELDWLCSYAFSAWDMVDQLDAFANNIQLDIGRER